MQMKGDLLFANRLVCLLHHSYCLERNEYRPDPISYTAAPSSKRRNLTPLACAAGIPPSDTPAASLAGTYTVAVVLAGIVTSIASLSPSRFQLLMTRP